jgi:hypothetical protein
MHAPAPPPAVAAKVYFDMADWPWTRASLTLYLFLYAYAWAFLTLSVWFPLPLLVGAYYDQGLAVAITISILLGIGAAVVSWHFAIIQRVFGLRSAK